jgi:membrane associated rhomboid family serine protease
MLKRFSPVIALAGLCWVVFVINNLLLDGRLAQHGIIPRQLNSLSGILWAPFLHASYQHLTANTVPLLILGGIICARSRIEFAFVTVAGIVLGGGLTWMFSRSAAHIGASGSIFCFLGYLASLAIFRRTLGAFILSALCILGYGGLLRGIVPTATAISWESHLAGLVAGIGLAWLSSRINPPRRDKLEDAEPPANVTRI